MDLEELTDDFSYACPRYETNRIKAIQLKISENTQLPYHLITIIECKIASEKNQFNVFPSLPHMAKQRKNNIHGIMKGLISMDNTLKYQLRNGNEDVVLVYKFQERGDYKRYKAVPLEFIDPEGKIPELETTIKDTANVLKIVERIERGESSTNTTDKDGFETPKRKNSSPSHGRKKKASIPKILEFLRAHFRGEEEVPQNDLFNEE